MLCSPANSTAGLRFGGTSESKKPQKIAQSREGVDKLKDLCEQKIHTHLSTPQRGHGNGQDFIMCMGKGISFTCFATRMRIVLQVTLITSILKIKSAFGGIPIEGTPCLPYASLAGTMI